jgi:hypothetical protein
MWGRAVKPASSTCERTDQGRLRLHRRPDRQLARRGHRRIRTGSAGSIDGRPVTVLHAIEELGRAGAPMSQAGRRGPVVGIKSRNL